MQDTSPPHSLGDRDHLWRNSPRFSMLAAEADPATCESFQGTLTAQQPRPYFISSGERGDPRPVMQDSPPTSQTPANRDQGWQGTKCREFIHALTTSHPKFHRLNCHVHPQPRGLPVQEPSPRPCNKRQRGADRSPTTVTVWRSRDSEQEPPELPWPLSTSEGAAWGRGQHPASCSTLWGGALSWGH